MSEECTHNCDTCSANCASREKTDFREAPHPESSIKKVIAVMSGKGGVGKSLVTSLLAVNMQRRGYKVGILDADLTGPSIPQMFGLHERAMGSETALYPVATRTGIDVMSLNLLIEDETDPVIWRGPVIAGTVKQFWTDVVWKDVDFLFVDMPPGTGDVPLTVLQSLPVDGVMIVTSPQELVEMIVEKAVKMAGMMNAHVLGVAENYSYYQCPSCGEKHEIYGPSRVEEIAKKYDIAHTARLPIDPKLAAGADKGLIELYEGTWLDGISDACEAMLKETK